MSRGEQHPGFHQLIRKTAGDDPVAEKDPVTETWWREAIRSHSDGTVLYHTGHKPTDSNARQALGCNAQGDEGVCGPDEPDQEKIDAIGRKDKRAGLKKTA